MTDTIKFNDKRYAIIREIGVGGMGAVYHARDRLTNRDVALKLVLIDQVMDIDSQATDSSVLLALANEFRTLASLRHRHIIEVLDYGFDTDGQAYFTMDFLQDAETILTSGYKSNLERRVTLNIQMLQALAYLHRNNIIHRDLKPENVLVNKAKNVKVLDFGLAKSIHKDDAIEDDDVAGTLSYIAPEVITGNTATSTADLYAVGVMLYELFIGKHPFNTENINELLQGIVQVIPDVSGLDSELLALSEGESENLAQVISRLLMKDPYLRYQDAHSTIQALCRALAIEMPKEDASIRESYLQRASFVGRDDELNHLISLIDVVSDDTTKTILIGGEAGVGKSRLVDETRIQAVVNGMAVYRGQCVSEGRSPYQVWRDIIRKLVLYVDISDVEASVLKPLVADLSAILMKDIADAPPLEPPAAQDRLNKVVEAVLRRYDQAACIIMQDLHWMGDESLALLQHILKNIHDRPLLFIADYRNDERADLPDLLTVADVMELTRFEMDTISQITHSMIGTPVQNQPILDFLYEHTEGNIYFLVETLRMLAEDAGTLEEIVHVTLPQSILSSGMERVIQYRLDKIPALLLQYIEAAALIGRTLDRKLIEYLFADIDYDDWLTICANAMIFEAQDIHWRFSHDKLREHILKSLSPDAKKTLHRQIGDAIEAVYGESPEMIAPLAHHFHEAGLAEKAIPYLVQASNQYLAMGLPRESLNYGLDAVRMLGIDMPHTASEAGQAIGAEIAKIQALLAGRNLSELRDLPKSDNQAITQAIGIMLQIAPSANIAQVPEFYVLMALSNFYLTLEHGSTMFTGAVFSVYASIFHINMNNDIQGGVELAQMAVEIDEEWGQPMRAFIFFVNQWLNLHWNIPLNEMPMIAEEGAKLGFETNSFVFGCFSIASVPMWHARISTPLTEVVSHARRAHETIQGNVSSAAFHSIHEMQLAKAFMGQTEDAFSLTDDEFNEERDIASVLKSQNVNQMAYYLWSKAMLHYVYDDSETAYDYILKTLPIVITIQGQMLEWEFDLFYTLILIDVLDSEHKNVEANLSKFQHYSQINPATFEHKLHLIQAEIAQSTEQSADEVYALYDASAEGAAASSFHFYAGLALERKGRYAHANNDSAIAQKAFQDAIQQYDAWGAHAKVADIKSRYGLR